MPHLPETARNRRSSGLAVLILTAATLCCSDPLPESKEFNCPCKYGWTCIDDVCRKYCESFSHCPEGYYCFEQGYCLPFGKIDPDCIPDCDGRECGNDGCGGSCGSCPDGESCLSDQCVEGTCVPSCQGKDCGDDGCGGICGSCYTASGALAPELCLAWGKCCKQDCVGKQCGGDGCGSLCAECPGDSDVCIDGLCCTPDCDELQCGPDGCGGTCGECTVCGQTCEDGKCLDTACQNKQCGDDGCGGTCGKCGKEYVCVANHCEFTGTLVGIRGGHYMRGCNLLLDDECDLTAEMPYGEIQVPAFYIDKYEVSGALYEMCMASDACTALPVLGPCNPNQYPSAMMPAVCVSWHQAKAYCEWADKRLCSEAEWEKAARGGCEVYEQCAAESRVYPWGNSPPTSGLACFAISGPETPEAIAAHPKGASPSGVLDMAGNAVEWVADCWHNSHDSSPTDGSAWTESCDSDDRVLKGGGALSAASELRISARDQWDPEAEKSGTGIRCCSTACGNDICETILAEDCSTCPADCGECTCGDGLCLDAENCTNCPKDCGDCCGNFVCSNDETCTSCPKDCGECCGNGECADDETLCTCPQDCGDPCQGKTCGDDGCGASCGECTGLNIACVDGSCKCQPDCDGMACGSDGCGGECGLCSVGQVCIDGHCPPAGDQCNDENDAACDGCTEGQISEFTISSPESINFISPLPQVATLGNDRYVVVWQNRNTLDSASNILGALLDSPAGTYFSELLISDDPDHEETYPAIAGLEADGFIVFWRKAGMTEYGQGLMVRNYSSTGVPTGSAQQMSAALSVGQGFASATRLTNGKVAAVWEGLTATGKNIYGAIGKAPELVLPDDYLINQDLSGAQSEPGVAALAFGGFVAVWESNNQGGKEIEIMARRYKSSGQPNGNEFAVNSFWEKNQHHADVASLADGGFVVAWMSCPGYGYEPSGQDGSGCEVFVKQYGADGVATSGDVLVNTEAYGDQDYPAIASFADGRFVVVWRSDEEDGTDSGIHFQRFKADGTKQWDSVRVDLCSSPASSPDITAFSDGSFVVLWTRYSQDWSQQTVHAQRFAADGTRLYR